jgi:hypothetical protein
MRAAKVARNGGGAEYALRLAIPTTDKNNNSLLIAD